MIVLDASVAVSWLLNQGQAQSLDRVLATRDIIVPSHWTVEVGHAILKALRRKVISEEHLSGIASDLNALGISVQPPIDVHAVLPLLRFAREHGLTLYDAAYVELALNRTAELATFDNAMSKVAGKLGVGLFVA